MAAAAAKAAPAFLQFVCLLPLGPTIWETKFPDPMEALALLNEWDQELRDCYAGQPSHPVFIALRETITALDIPIEPFSDLLIAFRQDQTVHRYATWNDVFDYCRYSANPVGRLVLYLCGYRDAERQRLSDATCTALQLANFWQDVTRDLEKGRIYIPLEALAAHGLTEDEIVQHRFDARYVSLMKELVARTRRLFAEGMPLAGCVDSALRVDIEMFSRGGLAVLDAIEAVGYNTIERRPSIPKSKQFSLLVRALFLRLFSFAQPSVPVVPAAPGRLAVVDGGRVNPSGEMKRQGSANEVAQSYAECRRIARASASNFYYAFSCLKPSETRCARYMRSCGSWTTSPTRSEARRTSSEGLHAGAPLWTPRQRATFRAIRFSLRSRATIRRFPYSSALLPAI